MLQKFDWFPNIVAQGVQSLWKDIAPWFSAHPNGRLIEYFKNKEEIDKLSTEYVQAYKGNFVAIMTQEQWLATK